MRGKTMRLQRDGGDAWMNRRKQSWIPPPPPRCPRIVSQTLPRRPALVRLSPEESQGLVRAKVCPPMQLIHPVVIVASLTQKAPTRPPPALLADVLPRIPLVIPPLLLSHVEMPPAAIFGSVKPARLVGRSCEDGGMPIHVHPSRATVVPPLVLTVSCLERADTALAAAGAVPQPSPEPPPRFVVRAWSAPLLEGLIHNKYWAYPSVPDLSRLAAAILDEPDTCHRIQGCSPLKPWRALVDQPFRTLGQEMGRSGNKTDASEKTIDMDSLAAFCQPPVLGWTVAMKESLLDPPRHIRCASPQRTPPPFIPSVPKMEPADLISCGVEDRIELGRMANYADHYTPSVSEASEGVLASRKVSVEFIAAANMETSTSEMVQSEQSGGTQESCDMKPQSTSDIDCVSSYSHSEQAVVWRDGGSVGNQSSPTTAPVIPRPIWRDREHQWHEGTTASNSHVCPVLSRDTASATLHASLGKHAKSQKVRAAPKAFRPKQISTLGTTVRQKRDRRGPTKADQPWGKGAVRQNDYGSTQRAIWRDTTEPTLVRKGLKRHLDSAGSLTWLKEADLLSFVELSFDCEKRQGLNNARQQQQWPHTSVATEPSQQHSHQKVPPENQKPRHHHDHSRYTTAQGVTIIEGPRHKEESKLEDIQLSRSAGTIHRQGDKRARPTTRRSALPIATELPPFTTVWTSNALFPETPPPPAANIRPLPSWFDFTSKATGVTSDPRKTRRQTIVRRRKVLLDRQTKGQHGPRAPAFEPREKTDDDSESRRCYRSRPRGLAWDSFDDGNDQKHNDGDRWYLPMLLYGRRRGEAYNCCSRTTSSGHDDLCWTERGEVPAAVSVDSSDFWRYHR